MHDGVRAIKQGGQEHGNITFSGLDRLIIAWIHDLKMDTMPTLLQSA
jgi:hypothetical protein